MGATRMVRLSVLIGTFVLALGATGVASAGVARHAVATKVTVTFTDKKFVVSPAGLQAGTANFVVVNKGQKPHALAIVGPGLTGVRRTPKLAAGKSATLTVTLKMGAYVLSDAVAKSSGHWLVVGPASVVSGGGRVNNVPGMTEPGMDCD